MDSQYVFQIVACERWGLGTEVLRTMGLWVAACVLVVVLIVALRWTIVGLPDELLTVLPRRHPDTTSGAHGPAGP